MKIQKLNLSQTDLLSACQFPLLLGITSSNNQLKNLIRYTAKVLQVGHALLFFKHEPYIWYYFNNELFAIEQKNIHSFEDDFQHHIQFDETHPSYSKVLQYLQQFGDYQRAVGFNFQGHEQYVSLIDIPNFTSDAMSFGHVIFFDERSEPFTALQKELVLEYCLGLVHYLKLKQDYVELKELYEQQQALNFSQTKFLSIISHDLRAPFHGLLGFSEVLATELEQLNPKSVQEIAIYLYDTSKSTYQLLENLLHWSMAEGGRFVYHPMQFKLKQVTDIVYDVLKHIALQKNIQLKMNVPSDLFIYADMHMLTSIIQNLLSNALKFTTTDGHGEVSLSAELVENSIKIKVKDNGLGMSAEQLKQLFQPRIRISMHGTAGEKGTGLGLSLSKRFVELNHGELHVESQEGKGSCFTLTLPRFAETTA